MEKKYEPLKLDDLMPFGKFKGVKMRVLIQDQTNYIKWAVSENVIELDNIAYDTYKRKTEQSA